MREGGKRYGCQCSWSSRRLLEVERFNEIGNCSHSGVAVATDAAIFALEIGAELTVRAEAGEDRFVVGWEVVLAKLFHVVPRLDGKHTVGNFLFCKREKYKKAKKIWPRWLTEAVSGG